MAFGWQLRGVVGQVFRDCLKTDDFTVTSVGAVREPPDIRALLEAPLPNKSGGP